MEAKTFLLSIMSAITVTEIVPKVEVSKLAVRKSSKWYMLLLLDQLDASAYNRRELGVTVTSTVTDNNK